MERPLADLTYVVKELPLGPSFPTGQLHDISSGMRTFRPVIDTEKCEITLYSVDGFCTKIVKYAVTNAKCTGAELLWTDNKTFDLSWNGSELIVDIKGNQTLDVKDLKDVLYVGHKDKSECKLGSFVIYDSVIAAEGHEADDSLELIKNMNDLRIVITNEKGDSWTATVKVTNTTPSNN